MSDLKDFIKNAKKRGYTKQDLTSKLLEKGYTKQEIDEAFSTSKKTTTQKETLSLGEKISGIFSPSTFFSSFKEKTILNSLTLFTITAVLIATISITLLSIYAGSRSFSSVSSLGNGIFMIIGGIIMTFIYSGISHLVIMIFKGEGTFIDTYNAVTYSLLPFIVSMLVPLIGLLSIIYSIILMTFSFSEYHNLSKGKSAVAALTPVLIVIIILILLVILLLSAFGF